MADGDDASAAAAPVVVFKKRGAKAKANLRMLPATPPPAASSDCYSDYSSPEDEAGRRAKRRRRNPGGTVVASSRTNRPAAEGEGLHQRGTVFAADRSVPITDSNDATKQTNWLDEDAPDALSSRSLLGSTRALPAKQPAADGTYRGLANQTKFIQRSENAPSRVVGPIKAATNIRTYTETDFKPDVCRDYKLTGFCGFGDTCKFLHAREDYTAGWLLDRERESVTKGKKNLGGSIVASANRSGGGGGGGDDDADDDDGDAALLESIPFACVICKESYTAPIVTRCGHYFCERCALGRYRRDPTCAACGAGTNGVFNSAKRLQKLLDRKRERAARRRQAAIDAGEELSVEEEDEE